MVAWVSDEQSMYLPLGGKKNLARQALELTCKAVILGSILKCKASADNFYLLGDLCVAIGFVYCLVHTLVVAIVGTVCSIGAKGVSQAVRYL